MKLVNFQINQHVALVELNRPEKLNALNWDLIEDLSLCFKKLSEHKEIRCLVLYSAAAPKSFCAGADLKERLGMNEEKVVETLDKLKDLCLLIENFPMPSIAVIDGVAFGGGLELALCCDLRIFAPHTKVALTETSLGIIPGAGGTQRLSNLVGVARAKESIFTSQIIEAEKAANWGLCNEINKDPFLRAQELASNISNKGPVALRAAKKSIDGGPFLSREDSLQWERKCYLETLETEDRREGLKAFVEKRKPLYCGK